MITPLRPRPGNVRNTYFRAPVCLDHLYVCNNVEDQTLLPGVITAVILAAASVNAERDSAALLHLIARSQDVACVGFLL